MNEAYKRIFPLSSKILLLSIKSKLIETAEFRNNRNSEKNQKVVICISTYQLSSLLLFSERNELINKFNCDNNFQYLNEAAKILVTN